MQCKAAPIITGSSAKGLCGDTSKYSTCQVCQAEDCGLACGDYSAMSSGIGALRRRGMCTNAWRYFVGSARMIYSAVLKVLKAHGC